MQNPAIFTNKHYKQAAYAVLAGIAIRIAIAIPVSLVSCLLCTVTPELTRNPET